MAAMQAGYHVLLEKPMATTLEECDQLTGSPTGKPANLYGTEGEPVQLFPNPPPPAWTFYPPTNPDRIA